MTPAGKSWPGIWVEYRMYSLTLKSRPGIYTRLMQEIRVVGGPMRDLVENGHMQAYFPVPRGILTRWVGGDFDTGIFAAEQRIIKQFSPVQRTTINIWEGSSDLRR